MDISPAGDSVTTQATAEAVLRPTVIIKEAVCTAISYHDIQRLSARLLGSDLKAILGKAFLFIEGGNKELFAFEQHRKSSEDYAWIVDVPEDEDTWFIGDLHGDLLALEASLSYITSVTTGKPRIVFLGDLFDDEGMGRETVIRIFELITKDPARVCILAGNHDEGLYFREAERRFASTVAPSDFADALNEHMNQSPDMQLIGHLAIKLFQRAPRALFFRDGLLVAHGGFPLSDLWEGIEGSDDLNAPMCLQDFVWTRAHRSIRKKIPNRTSKGSQYGHEDFKGFCEKVGPALGFPISKMIRGHDHVEDRYEIFEKYDNKVMTINTLSRRLPREVSGEFERTPCVARYVKGEMPEIHRLKIPTETIRQVYARQLNVEETEEPQKEPEKT